MSWIEILGRAALFVVAVGFMYGMVCACDSRDKDFDD